MCGVLFVEVHVCSTFELYHLTKSKQNHYKENNWTSSKRFGVECWAKMDVSCLFQDFKQNIFVCCQLTAWQLMISLLLNRLLKFVGNKHSACFGKGIDCFMFDMLDLHSGMIMDEVHWTTVESIKKPLQESQNNLKNTLLLNSFCG